MNKRNKNFNNFTAVYFYKLATQYKRDLLEVKNREVLKINENAENGRVLIVWGQRDCDGSQSDGYT